MVILIIKLFNLTSKDEINYFKEKIGEQNGTTEGMSKVVGATVETNYNVLLQTQLFADLSFKWIAKLYLMNERLPHHKTSLKTHH